MVGRGRNGHWWLVAAGVVVTAIAGGCGGDDAPPTSTRAATAPSTPATTTSGPAPATSAPTTVVPAAGTVAPAAGTVVSTATGTPSTTENAPSSETPPTVGELLELGRPLVLAHAGGEQAYPTSTMFAFAESVAAGVDMLDLDVVLSADGVLMVQHDDTVDRLTDGTGAVTAMTAAELGALDNAYWFTPEGVGPGRPADAYVYRGVRTGERPPPAGYTPDDFAIPRLDELIARFPRLPLNIEIKGEGPAAADAATALADLLARTGRKPSTVVSAFDDATIAAFHAAAPGVEVSPGLETSTAFVLGGTPLPAGMRILQLPPEYQGIEVLTPATVDAAHAAGYLIWVWPNVTESTALYVELLAQGMDALNANLPVEAVDAVARFGVGG